MSAKHFVIIGAGAAGSHGAFRIRELEPSAAITILNKEPYPFYHRYDLPQYLAGTIRKKALFHGPKSMYTNLDIHLRLSQPVARIDTVSKTVYLEHRESVQYDRLLLATGIRSRLHPVYTYQDENFVQINDLADVENLIAQPAKLNKPLIVGGSLSGLKIALALSKSTRVEMVMESHLTGNLLARPGDVGLIKRLLEKKEVRVRMDDTIDSIRQSGGEFEVGFNDGSLDRFSILIAAFGVQPNNQLARTAGITCELGVIVNEYFQTSQKDVYAAGDVAQIYNSKLQDYWVNFGWPNAVKQGFLAGQNMCGETKAYDTDVVNVFDVKGSPINVKSWQ